LVNKYELLSIAHLDSREFGPAIELLKKAAVLVPDNAEIHHWLGTAYFMSGQMLLAEVEEKMAIGIDPLNSYALNGLANVYSDLGRYDEAIALYKSAIRIASTKIITTNLASIDTHQRDRDTGIATLRLVVSRYPHSSIAFNNLALLYEQKGDFDEALRCLSRAIELNPSDPAAQNNLGAAYGRLNRFDRAVECLKLRLP
jgi:tetratricopeptide (TPR) repeat protein